jgi:glycosyltransferase involved in cell wall biosynthesis
LSPAIFRPLRLVAKRLVISAHDFFLVCPNGGYYDFDFQGACDLRPMSASCLIRPCDRRSYGHKVWRLLRHTLRQALFNLKREGATIVAVHDGMLPLLERGGLRRSQLTSLRNPVTPWSTTRIRAESNRVFVYVGRLDADKGVDLFVAAAREAVIPVRIIGSGPLQGQVSQTYPAAEFIPWCQPEDIRNHVRDARVVVVPSRARETFGLVAFEALTSGIPVLVSNLAMISDEITAMGGALACDPHDQRAFIGALSRLASDDSLIESMSRSAHANAQRMSLSPAEWMSRLLLAYGVLLRRSATEFDEGGPEPCSMARG